MNKKLLNEIADRLDDLDAGKKVVDNYGSPLKFFMGDWLEGGSAGDWVFAGAFDEDGGPTTRPATIDFRCDTTGCIAGWAVALSLDPSKPFNLSRGIVHTAQAELELGDDLSSELFLMNSVDGNCTHAVISEHLDIVAGGLRNLAQSDDEDWDWAAYLMGFEPEFYKELTE